MTSPPSGSRAPISAIIASLRRLPDLRAALEAIALFILVMIAGVLAARGGILELSPSIGRGDVLALAVTLFFVPSLLEEIVFRGWLRSGAPVAAVISLLAYIAWHPLQTALNLPTARPEYMQTGFLALIGFLGLACTLTRLRSGSIWPGVIIHWGAVVVWTALYTG